MTNCPKCGAPPVTIRDWGCGTKWRNNSYEYTTLCRMRHLSHELGKVRTTLELYEDSMGDIFSEKELILRLKEWYDRGGKDPWELHQLVFDYFQQGTTT